MKASILTAAILVAIWAPVAAQHPPGWVACEFKWQDAGKPPDYKKFMNDCVTTSERRDGPAKTTADRTFDQSAIAALLDAREQSNYRSISFQDFKLDGKELASHHTKLRLQGFYKKFGDLETLQPSALAVAAAREYGSDTGIPLLTEDATRASRKIFLECGDNPLRPLGCPITIAAHADICTVGSMLGARNVPCLVVEDGR